MTFPRTNQCAGLGCKSDFKGSLPDGWKVMIHDGKRAVFCRWGCVRSYANEKK